MARSWLDRFLETMPKVAYFAAEKRLSNEFAERTGCAPATRLSADGAGAGAAAALSVAFGFEAG